MAKLLRASGAVFRTLALSATVGTDLGAVQRVVDLLHLSQMELLTEDDPELLAHSHIKQVDVLVRVRVRVRVRISGEWR